MSRVGKKIILIPAGVEVKTEGPKITVKGPKGELSKVLPPEIKAETKDGKITFVPQLETKKTNALWGLSRALVFSMVKGVTEGFEKKLEIEGVGYGAELSPKGISLKVGYINQIPIEAPLGIKFSIEKNVITVSGIDKELVGQTASTIRSTKPAEPYKGKGIKYVGEIIRRKVGKRVTTTAAG